MDKTKKHILKRAGTCVAVVLMLYLFNRLTNQAFKTGLCTYDTYLKPDASAY